MTFLELELLPGALLSIANNSFVPLPKTKQNKESFNFYLFVQLDDDDVEREEKEC